MSDQSEQLAEVLAEARENNRLARLAREQIETCAAEQKNQLNQALSNSLVFPEILTPSYTLAISTAVGQITVDPGQQWLHRGWKIYSSDDYELAARQFTTQAGKTYHLRWSPADGFALKDLSDALYNPAALAEEDIQFDSNYDDMLICRIISDENNLVNITTLKSKSYLETVISVPTGKMTSNGQVAAAMTVVTLNWSRTPVVNWSDVSVAQGGFVDMLAYQRSEEISRYGLKLGGFGYNTHSNFTGLYYTKAGFTVNLKGKIS